MSSDIDIYTEHFGLRERPFNLVPDPAFLYWGPAHKRAYAILEYGIMTRAPITLLTGEVGAGKTTLLQHLLRSIREEVRVGLISNAHGNPNELLRWVLHALDQPSEADQSYIDLFSQFEAFLLEEYAAGRRVVLIFDEAQNLGRAALEELRMYTNINSGKDELLQLILVGQPELREIVRRPDMTQFAQRVASGFHLSAMTEEVVAKYIGHRVALAGGTEDLFSPGACRAIYEATGGVPRLVNQLCDLSLVYAFTSEDSLVTAATVQDVLGDGVFFGGGLSAEPLRVVNPDKRTSTTH
ncbi:AAA family ATPase [Paracoccus sp. TK19116]|uniref:AAA family ATPase n=1 Tax=Paracoccus albicereus TaxID=2922394 RepID=A0ABT1MNF3_9RHOB|nr:AAA family ATPase [Paracoccus albicereus]MCQ0969701.1 AAA family ATPase [Paracoccus albicereus]